MPALAPETCRTRNRLYEQHERLALKLIASQNGRFKLMKASKLEKINEQISVALRQLHEHEQTHRCA